MAKKKKYSQSEYTKEDRALKAKLELYAENIKKRRGKLASKFINANSPVQVGKVYNIVEGGIKRRGYDRFVVFQQHVQFVGGSPIVIVGGWWINKLTDKAEKWDDSGVVLGVGNPTVYKLADNQKYINPDKK